MGTETTISIAFIIAAVGFFITIYNTLSSVTVNAIPMTETDNSYGGKTLTIGA